MRKLVFIAILSSVFAVANAQDNMMSKRGTPILPEVGDYSLGIDAVPFIDWMFDKTRVFSNTPVTSAGGAVAPQRPMTIVGLYVKDANTCYRGKVGINITSHSQDYAVSANNDSATASNRTDNIKTSTTGITLGAGIQKTRGKGRLHGIYGAEALIGFSSGSKNTYSYGNGWVLDNNYVVSGSATTPVGPGESHHINSTGTAEVTDQSRVTETKSGSNFTFGVDAFAGIEYFCAPKMSISAEYNWGIFISSNGEGSTTTESTVAPTGTSTTWTTKSVEAKTGKSSDFNLANGDINTPSTVSSLGTGSIVFHFYF